MERIRRESIPYVYDRSELLSAAEKESLVAYLRRLEVSAKHLAEVVSGIAGTAKKPIPPADRRLPTDEIGGLEQLTNLDGELANIRRAVEAVTINLDVAENIVKVKHR